MTINMRPEVERQRLERMGSGPYLTPDEVINDALSQVFAMENELNFEPGELGKILAFGEQKLAAGLSVDGDKAVRDFLSRKKS